MTERRNEETYKLLSDLSTDEYFDHRDALRLVAKAEDEGLSEIEFVRSELDPQRYAVVFHGVSIGWVVRGTCDNRWRAYVTQPGTGQGKLVDEGWTRKGVATEIIWKAGR